MDEQSRKFHLEEYVALRAEMLSFIERTNANRNFMFVSVAASIAWLLTNGKDMGPWAGLIAAWIPFLIVEYFLIYRSDHSEALRHLGEYIKRLEDALGAEGFGWEKNTKIKDGKRFYKYQRTKNIFLYMQIGTSIFAVYFMAKSQSWGVVTDVIHFAKGVVGALHHG